jgi:RNA polymerase sigma-70 factor, ECF subfamily
MKEIDYDKLIVETAAGNREAFEALYHELKTVVYGLALSILQNPTLAEDAMQDVFVRIWHKAYQYKPSNKGRQWIAKLTRNLCLDMIKSRKFEILDDKLEESSSLIAQYSNNHMDSMVLRETLDKLGLQERQIVIMHALTGYSHKEIAYMLQLPYASVRWKYHYALKKLSKSICLDDLFINGGGCIVR